MIESLSDITLDGFVALVYAAIAGAVVVGCVVGVAVNLLSTATRGGQS